MIFFEGFNQGYTVEELSFKQVKQLLVLQAEEESETNKEVGQLFSQAHSYRTRLDVKVNCKSS